MPATPNVVVCVVAYGRGRYFRAAGYAVRSALARTNFDVFVAVGPGRGLSGLPSTPRLRQQPFVPPDNVSASVEASLAKCAALHLCLTHTTADVVLLIDANALIVGEIFAAQLTDALRDAGLGMAEEAPPRRADQRTTTSSSRINTGVIIGRRAELEALVRWALQGRSAHDATAAPTSAAPTATRVDSADLPPPDLSDRNDRNNDLFHQWARLVGPARATLASWRWNHSEEWDEDFPRRGAYIWHFTDEGNGPGLVRRWRMRRALKRIAPDA